MSVQSNAPPPLLVLVGLAFLLGAAALAWFSAVATLHLTRTDANSARAEFHEKLFAFYPIASESVAGIRSAVMVSGRLPDSTSRSNTPSRLVFETATGRVDLGHVQQRFAPDFTDVRDFLDDPAQRELAVSSIGRFQELLRFLAAQLGVVFLASFGALSIWLGLRGLFPDPDAGIGPV